jgi:cytochrome b
MPEFRSWQPEQPQVIFSAMTDSPDHRTVRVWDLPTRAFHWLLAVTVIAAIVTAKIGGNALAWHMRLGLLALALIAFRLVWGFVGGRWSRFGSFLYGPSSVLAYLRGDAGPQGRYDVGHSPLGALSVFALLTLLIAQVATGLVADDEIATTGPLYKFVSSAVSLRATSWHKSVGQYLIIAVVLLHVGAVLFYLFERRRNLIAPMWHGDKTLPAHTPASADGAAQRTLAAALLAAALGLSWWIARQGA